MSSLLLTQKEADELIKLFKELVESYSATLVEGSRGTIPIRSNVTGRRFRLDYYYAKQNVHINFNDIKTNLSLVRLNLNNSFHKNSNGERVRGNRVNLFSEKEYLSRDDGQYMKAYKLPYKNLITNPTNFMDALHQILAYTNVKNYDTQLNISIQEQLTI